MKNRKLLLMAGIGFAMVIAGLCIPGKDEALHFILLIAGAFILLGFYFLTFLPVIQMVKQNIPDKISWFIFIICLPIVGNVVYLIFQETANRKQKQHPEAF